MLQPHAPLITDENIQDVLSGMLASEIASKHKGAPSSDFVEIEALTRKNEMERQRLHGRAQPEFGDLLTRYENVLRENEALRQSNAQKDATIRSLLDQREHK